MSLREHEGNHADLSMVKKSILGTREVNFGTTKRRLAREEFREQLLKVAPFKGVSLLKHLFPNNKPEIWIIFKTYPEDAHEQVTEGIKNCQE